MAADNRNFHGCFISSLRVTKTVKTEAIPNHQIIPITLTLYTSAGEALKHFS